MYSVSSYCKTYYPEGMTSLLYFTLLCQNHQKENLFRENICFSGLEPGKLMQLTIFHFFKRYNLYIKWNFKIIKPSWRYAWFSKYYQATYSVHMDGLYWYTNWLLGKGSLCTKYQYFHRPFYLNHQTYSWWNCYLDTER